MTYREAAKKILQERGPMHYKELADAIVSEGMVETIGATPEATVNSQISREIVRNGDQSEFIRVRAGVFGLRRLQEESENDGANTEERHLRVRIAFLPLYSQVRCLLQIWPGFQAKQVTGMLTTLHALMGTPQKPVNWTSPADWIPERLQGSDRELAQAIWERSDGAVNPRYVRGHWFLIRGYELLREDGSSGLQLSEKGRDFLEQQGGKTESEIDEFEGLFKLLAMVSDRGQTPAGGLVDEWEDYLSRRSRFNSKSTVKDTMQRRLANLLERQLIGRKGIRYSITHAGSTYLKRTIATTSAAGIAQDKIRTLVRKHHTTVREDLKETLHEINPVALEHLIKRLLEKMGYQNVIVTAQSGDKGVDVVADIELGISSVREVVQVKRHRGTIQRKTLDELRGSLHRFGAVRGTIFTTSRFASGAHKAAFEDRVAPITLIDGDKLADLLIEHDIGVQKQRVELLELDADDLSAREADE